MAEYIKKEDIEQKIQDCLNNLVLGHDAIEVLGMIYEMTAADVAPVRHGRWEYRDDGFGGTYYHCSVCGEDWCTIDGTPAENGMRYCPQCGARMDGDADG